MPRSQVLRPVGLRWGPGLRQPCRIKQDHLGQLETVPGTVSVTFHVTVPVTVSVTVPVTVPVYDTHT